MKKHLRELDYFDFLLCMTVIFIHASSEAVGKYDKSSAVYAVVFVLWKAASFVVPAFVFLGGLRFAYSLSGKGGKLNYAAYILKRIKRVYLPYLLWVVIYYVYFMNKGYFPFDIKDLSEYIFSGTLVAHFYFVIIIMQFYLLSPIWYLIARRSNTAAAVTVAAVITVFCRLWLLPVLEKINPDFIFRYNDRMFTTYLVFWVTGCCAGADYAGFVRFMKRMGAWIAGSYISIAARHIYRSYQMSFGEYRNPLEDEVMQVAFCVISTLFFLLICFLIAEKSDSGGIVYRIVKRVSGVSFYIYLCHILIMLVITSRLDNMLVASISARYAAKLFLTPVISAALCLLYDFIKKSVRNNQNQ